MKNTEADSGVSYLGSYADLYVTFLKAKNIPFESVNSCSDFVKVINLVLEVSSISRDSDLYNQVKEMFSDFQNIDNMRSSTFLAKLFSTKNRVLIALNKHIVKQFIDEHPNEARQKTLEMLSDN